MKNRQSLNSIKNNNVSVGGEQANRTKLNQDEFQALVDALGCYQQNGQGIDEKLEKHHQILRARQRKFRAMLGEDMGGEFLTDEEMAKQKFKYKIGNFVFN